MSNDRISNLSDHLLCHILSFLPTKNAVATSILSKRWNPLWRSTSTLDFNDEGHTQNQTQHLHFAKFVYSILISRDITQPVKTFCLHCLSKFTCNFNINKWVNHAIQHPVERLEIHCLKYGLELFMPPTVFTCQTIVTLKLSGLKVKDFSCVCLPSLKNLQLHCVRFANSACVAKLLSGCIFLEHLLSISPPLDKDCVEVFPKLIKAVVHFDMPWKPLCRAKALYLNLDSLDNYKDVSTFSNLVRMGLYLCSSNWKCLVEILRKSPKLQILKFWKKRTGTSNGNEMVGHFVTGSTARLSSNLKKCYMSRFEGEEFELQFAKYIMENATALTLMKISSSDALNSDAKLQMAQKLMSCKRVSRDCQLLFK